MISLYLDDVRNPPDDSWTLCRSLDEAKALLVAGVEYASLDHDLGACAACTEDAADPIVICSHVPTGYDLVQWMIASGHWPKHRPLVHSANPAGRRNMLAAIERWFGHAAQGLQSWE